MPDQAGTPPSNGRYVPWLLLYVLLIAYSSTVVGPAGFHFVPLAPDEAWARFMVRMSVWVDNGSDQRADWMGNLAMYVPFGFLLAGALWPIRARVPKVSAAVFAALALTLAFLLAVKYAQLFFPPRTVTLNYVVAQACGGMVGIACYWAGHGRLARLVWRGDGRARENLRHILQLYAVGLFVFVLMPLDFALSTDDLLTRIDRLPEMITYMPGAGRSPVVKAVLLAAGTLATAPFGMLLVLGPRGRNRFLAGATLRGFVWMAVLLVLSALLLSGAPSLLSLVYRTLGITLGAGSMRWLSRQDTVRLRAHLARWSLWAVIPFLVLLLSVNGLFSTHWRTPAEVTQSIYRLGLLPLFDYYIVTKAEAAKNIVAHAIMYAPLGLFAWLRGHRPFRALICALLLASLIESGRYFRPGLEGDINAVAVAGLSALLAAQLMPAIWRMLEGVARPKASLLPETVPGWRERAAAARLRSAARIGGPGADDIEHF